MNKNKVVVNIDDVTSETLKTENLVINLTPYPKNKFQLLFLPALATLVFFLIKVVVECFVNFIESLIESFSYVFKITLIGGLSCVVLFIIDRIITEGLGAILYDVGMLVFLGVLIGGSFLGIIFSLFFSGVTGILTLVLKIFIVIKDILNAICVFFDRKYEYFFRKLQENVSRI